MRRERRLDGDCRLSRAALARLKNIDGFIKLQNPSPSLLAADLPLLPAIPRGSLVVVEGRVPIWRYGMALRLLHGSPAAAVAFYDPRLGAVVVATHSPEWQVGQVVDVTLRAEGTEARQ